MGWGGVGWQGFSIVWALPAVVRPQKTSAAYIRNYCKVRGSLCGGGCDLAGVCSQELEAPVAAGVCFFKGFFGVFWVIRF